MTKNVKIIIGANYGEEGKGQVARFFAINNPNPIVIFYQGSHNRGATIDKPDGFNWRVSHFGAGTFDNISTYFAPDFMFSPEYFNTEYNEITFNNYKIPTPYIDENCRIITPVDIILDIMRLVSKREQGFKWSSCCVGTNSCDARSKHPELNFKYKDFIEKNPIELCNYIYDNWFSLGMKELGITHVPECLKQYSSRNPGIIDGFYEYFIGFKDIIERIKSIAQTVTFDTIYNKYDSLIFESSAGLLIKNTASNTGVKNVVDLLKNYSNYKAEACYLTRTYLTRHGCEEFPEEDYTICFDDRSNEDNFTNGLMRFGRLKYPEYLLRCQQDFSQAPTHWKMSTILLHMNEMDCDFANEFNYWSFTPYAEEIITNKEIIYE